MAKKIACPVCLKTLTLPDRLVGKVVRCSKCSQRFLAELPAEGGDSTPETSAVLDPDGERKPAGIWLTLLAVLVALPLLSFARPFVGYVTFLILLGLAWAVAALGGVLYWGGGLLKAVWAPVERWLKILPNGRGLLRTGTVLGLGATILVAGEAFAGRQGLLALLVPAVSQVQFDLLTRLTPPQPEHPFVEVVVTGQGIDREQALKDSFRSALHQTIGTLVDSKTVLENDELIQDRILTYSHGYISDYQILSSETRQGLVELRVRATVRQEQVLVKLFDSKVPLPNIKGEQIYAITTTRKQMEEDALASLQLRLGDFARILKAEEPRNVSQWYETKGDGGKDGKEPIVLSYKLRLRVDPERYRLFETHLDEVLAKTATEIREVTTAADIGTDVEEKGPRGATVKHLEVRKMAPDQNAKFAPGDASGEGPVFVFLNSHGDKLSQRLSWKRYAVSEAIFKQVQASLVPLNRPLTLRTQLQDKKGQLISPDELAGLNRASGSGLTWTPGATLVGKRAILIGPYSFAGGASALTYWVETEVQGKQPITLQEVKDVAGQSRELAFEP